MLKNKKDPGSFIQDTLKDPRWNYLEVRDGKTLSPDIKRSQLLTVLGVFQLRTTRLLDNVQVELK
jgi:pantothenate synthetase